MRVQDYSQAVIELLQGGDAFPDVLTKLKELLARKGHMRLYPKILRSLLREVTRDTARGTISVTLARETDEETLKSHIANAIRSLEGSTHTTRIDPTITGGFIAEMGEKRIDQSYKRKLLTLYRSLIA